MNDAEREYVRSRAAGRCEYCRFPEHLAWVPFHVDHIIAQRHDGPTVSGNLAWSCRDCNTYKGQNIAGWISETESIMRLYHPRKDRWEEHFEWDGPWIRAKSDVGRVTIYVLKMNEPELVDLRRWMQDLGESL